MEETVEKVAVVVVEPDANVEVMNHNNNQNKIGVQKEQTDSTTGKSKWTEIENQWIELYRNRKPKDGLSATHKVTGDDEWLCEAYMKTDYTKLTERDFQQTINEYLSYLVKEGNVYEA